MNFIEMKFDKLVFRQPTLCCSVIITTMFFFLNFVVVDLDWFDWFEDNFGYRNKIVNPGIRIVYDRTHEPNHKNSMSDRKRRCIYF